MDPGFVRDNWAELQKIPGWLWFGITLAFITLLFSGVAITWKISQSIFEATLQKKDATLEQMTATLGQKEAAHEATRNQLAFVIEQREEYRSISEKQKVEIVGKATAFSRTKNKVLQDRALAVVGKIRAISREMRNYAIPSMRNLTPEQYEAEWEKERKRSNDLMFRYESEAKSDAILLRDEIFSRLPKEIQPPGEDPARFRSSMYEHPTNPIGLDTVADDLERLAKLLDTQD